MTGEDCRYDSGVTDPLRTVGPYSRPLRRQSLPKDGRSCPTDARDARDCSPGGAYRLQGRRDA